MSQIRAVRLLCVPGNQTFTRLVKCTALRHVLYHKNLEFALAILLVKQFGHPEGFGSIPAGTPYKVTGLEELVGNMACDEAVGSCDQHRRARRDDWGLAIEFERHGSRINGNGECHEQSGIQLGISGSRITSPKRTWIRLIIYIYNPGWSAEGDQMSADGTWHA